VTLDFKNKYDSYTQKIDEVLENFLYLHKLPSSKIIEAIKYSIKAGGKRLRPVLAVSVCDMLGGNIDDVLPFACAIEMIHTYSLIHDDLPAMDNDDYRRGKPTNHKVFGEGTAVLAGDALLNLAFEIMIKSCMESFNGYDVKKAGEKTRAMGIIAEASGIQGMIGGQALDIEYEGRIPNRELLRIMHACKTGALIKAPILSSAVICGASDEELDQLEVFGKNLGLGFQIKDDILDVEGTFDNLGKSIGSDENKNKATYVSFYGVEKSRLLLKEATDMAIHSLERFKDKSGFLKELTLYMYSRNH
jgi:geranylgeranyl diphosphate synthase, type II